MATLVDRINLLATRAAAESKALRVLINNNAADLTALTTTAKTNLVAAINEVRATALALINDAATATSSTWSSTKIAASIAALIADASTALTTTWSSTKIAASIAALINDSTTTTSSVWSSSKTYNSITTAVANLVNSSPTTLDTLKELADAIGDDPAFATTMTTALGNRLRFDAAQTLTAPQKVQGKANLDAYGNLEIGTPDTDFVATFNTGLL